MARAVLEIHADGSEIKRVFGEIAGLSRETSAAMAADWKKAGDAALAMYEKVKRAAAAAAAATRREEKETTREAERESRRREQFSEHEGNYRTSAARRQRTETESSERDQTSAVERESRRRVDIAKREARERVAEARKAAQDVVAAGSVIARGAGAVHNVVQAPRVEAATIEATMADLWRQSGATAAEAGNLHSGYAGRIMQTARAEGMNPQQLASSMLAAQSEFSILNGASPAERQRQLDAALQSVVLANDTGAAPGEVLRLGGALAARGVGANSRERTIRRMIRMAREGSVDFREMVGTHLSAMTGRIGMAQGALGPRATAAQRAAAAESATMETMAELEAFGEIGERGRGVSGQIRVLSGQLSTDYRQQRILGRIRAVEGSDSAMEGALFERYRDNRGRDQSRLRREFTDPTMGFLRLGRRMESLVGGDQTKFLNIMGSGFGDGSVGGSRVQGMERAQQRLMSGLFGGGFARVEELYRAGPVSEADRARTRQITQNLDQTRLNRESIDAMLNARAPGVAQDVSDRARTLQAEHPFLSGPGLMAAGAAALKWGPRLLSRGGGLATGILGALSTFLRSGGGDTENFRAPTNAQEAATYREQGLVPAQGGRYWVRGSGYQAAAARAASAPAAGAQGGTIPVQAQGIEQRLDRLIAVTERTGSNPLDHSLREGEAASAPGRQTPAP